MLTSLTPENPALRPGHSLMGMTMGELKRRATVTVTTPNSPTLDQMTVGEVLEEVLAYGGTFVVHMPTRVFDLVKKTP